MIKTPYLAVDAIIIIEGKVLLIKRKNPPFGWALPGGFVDIGESTEDAVKREVKEETCLDAQNVKLMGVYSDPKRDPRFHNVSIAYEVKATGKAKAADDAKEVQFFIPQELPEMAFDHKKILEDYFERK